MPVFEVCDYVSVLVALAIATSGVQSSISGGILRITVSTICLYDITEVSNLNGARLH